MVLSLGHPIGAAFGPDSGPGWHEANGGFAERIREHQPSPIAEVRAPWGGGHGFERDPIGRAPFAPPLIVTTPLLAPSAVWIVIVVDVGSPLSGSSGSHDGGPPSRGTSGTASQQIAPLAAAAALGGLSAPQFSSAAGDAQATSSTPSPPVPVWVASATGVEQEIAQTFSTVPTMPWLHSGGSDAAPRVESAPTERDMLAPDGPHSSEGGFIELDPERQTGPNSAEQDDPLDELGSRRKRAQQERAALEWVWSELDRALKNANEVLSNANAARKPASAEPMLAREGGMIELAVDGAAIPSTPMPAASRPLDAVELSMEAGVALYQAFELGTAPGEAAEPSGPAASAGDGVSQVPGATADDGGETLTKRAAFVGAALVPLVVRGRSSSDDAKKPGWLNEMLRRLGL
jgi:hypothetical protein